MRLSLEPNHELFQDAKVEYIDAAGDIVRTEPIVRHDYKVYKGLAYVRDENTKDWRHSGWARITILRDGRKPLFEGVFIKDEDVHHVKLLSKYNSQKSLEDGDVGLLDADEIMVVLRDSDRLNSRANLLERSLDGTLSIAEANASICAHDRLNFNIESGNRVRRFGYDVFGRLVRRQGNDVGGTTGGSRGQLASTIGHTNGCPTTRQVALVAVAADCTYVSKFANSSAARSSIISIYNQV